MRPLDYDVFICCRPPSGTELARMVSAELGRRGFRVFLEDRLPGAATDRRPAVLIESIPDFVVVLTAQTLDQAADEDDPVRREIARALETGRNVVPVLAPGCDGVRVAALPPSLAGLSGCPPVAYDPGRHRESIALVAHHLSSDATVDDRRLMRRFRWIFLAAAVALVAGVGTQAVPALITWWSRPKPLPPLPPFTLHWSGFAQRTEGPRPIEIPLLDGSRIVSGDQIRIVFSPSADGFAYVVSKDVRGRISVLFPADAFRGASRVRAGRLYTAPLDAGWLTVDERAGIDTLYVVASYDPLQNMEELVEEPESESSAGVRRGLVESTVSGLLDGRHLIWGRQLRTRTGQLIDSGLTPRPGPSAFSVTLADGGAVTHQLAVQPGLVSAGVELRLRFERPQ